MLSWAKANNSGYNYQNKAVRTALAPPWLNH